MSSEPEPATALAPDTLLRALRHLLAPLVRLLLANQITYPLFSALLKGVYVEMADREFRLEGRPQTASRTSLLTGIHRKEIRRLREEAPVEFTPPASVSLGARLVLQWTGSPRFLDRRQRPLVLPLHDDGSGGPCFEDLVASISTDIRARSVLDEWQRLGVVEMDAEGRMQLRVDAFVPSQGFDEKAQPSRPPRRRRTQPRRRAPPALRAQRVLRRPVRRLGCGAAPPGRARGDEGAPDGQPTSAGAARA